MSEDHEYPPLTSQQRETTTSESHETPAPNCPTPKTPRERLAERVRLGIEASRKRAKEDPHYQVPY